MEEIQLLHTQVLCHVVDSGCRAPHELRALLCVNEGRESLQDESMFLAELEVEPKAMENLGLDCEEPSPPTAGATLSRRRSDAPSPVYGMERFVHGSRTYQHAESKRRAQEASLAEATCSMG